MKLYVRSSSQKKITCDSYYTTYSSEKMDDDFIRLLESEKNNILYSIENKYGIRGTGFVKGPVEITRCEHSESKIINEISISVMINVRLDYLLILNSPSYDSLHNDLSDDQLNTSRNFLESEDIDPDKYVKIEFICEILIDDLDDADDNTLYEQFLDKIFERGFTPKYNMNEKPELLYGEWTDKHIKDVIQHNNIKKLTRSSKKGTWAATTYQLRDEWEAGIDSIDEGTSAGSIISDISLEVEDKLGITSEPSIQAGVGSMNFFDSYDGDLLFEEDYQTFNEILVELATESSSKTVFKKKLEKWYRSMIL